jgi:hypothetical protein
MSAVAFGPAGLAALVAAAAVGGAASDGCRVIPFPTRRSEVQR